MLTLLKKDGPGIGVFVFLIALALFIFGSPPPVPRLVGFDCQGASGPLYADEEDMFPRCERIEVND